MDYLIEVNLSNNEKPLISDYHATNHQGDKTTEALALSVKQIFFFTSVCFVIAKDSNRPNISRVPFACWIFEVWLDLFFLDKFSVAKFKILLFLIGSSNLSTLFWHSYTNVSLLGFPFSSTVKRYASVALDACLKVFKLNKEFWSTLGKNGLIVELICLSKFVYLDDLCRFLDNLILSFLHYNSLFMSSQEGFLLFVSSCC